MIECACGCGELIEPIDKWNKKRRYVKGHYNKGRYGQLSHMWRGGRKKTISGYILIYKPDHPYHASNYVPEHRLVMEQHLGRYLRPDENIHHINGIKEDNRIENLQIMTNNEHIALENSLREWTKESRAKIGAIVKARRALERWH